jgi:hypothetical protein
MKLFNKDESWTIEGAEFACKVGNALEPIFEQFIQDNPDVKIRELELIGLSELNVVALKLIMDKRFRKEENK